MKNYLLAAALAAAPVLALAQSANTILFQGEVTDQTCAVSVNGNGTTPLVLLKTIRASELSTSGSTAGATNFNIRVTGCTAPQDSALAIKTVFIGNQITVGGNLGNTGDAKNVALQLLDPANPGVPFNLNSARAFEAPGLSLAKGATSAEHAFAVRYIAEGGAATAGSVLGSVQYALSYR